MKYLKFLICALLNQTCRLLDFLYPKDNSLIVFSQALSRYSDNSRALYEYLSASSYFSALWLAETKTLKEFIEKQSPSYIVIQKHSIRGIFALLKARTFVLSHGPLDIGPFFTFSKRKKIVMLWHSITLKCYGVMDHKFVKELSSKKPKKLLSNNYSLMIASSQVDRLAAASCNNFRADRIRITGLPRNDILMSTDSRRGSFVSEEIRKIDGKNLILYAPTFRDVGSATRFFPFPDFDIRVLSNFMEKHDSFLLFRPHQNDSKNIDLINTWRDENSERFILASKEYVRDVCELLPSVKVIVTDYSSIYIDFMLLDRPAIFIPYDLEEYERVRGLIYDYETVTPGPKVSSQSEFLLSLESALKGAPEYSQHRQYVKRMFHKYFDGRACERVADEIKKLVLDERS